MEPTNLTKFASCNGFQGESLTASGHTSRDGAIRDVGLICPQVDGYPRTAPLVDTFSCPLPFEPSPRGHGALVRRCHAAGALLQSTRPWQCAASTMEKSLRSRDFRTATKLTWGTPSDGPRLYFTCPCCIAGTSATAASSACAAAKGMTLLRRPRVAAAFFRRGAEPP